MNQKISLT